VKGLYAGIDPDLEFGSIDIPALLLIHEGLLDAVEVVDLDRVGDIRIRRKEPRAAVQAVVADGGRGIGDVVGLQTGIARDVFRFQDAAGHFGLMPTPVVNP